ncbi:hypothetical protein D9M68_616410 [compost metagenome]
MVEHNNPALRARQDFALAKARANIMGWDTREGAKELYAAMIDKLLRAMDRRDPWTAADLSGWVHAQFTEFLETGISEQIMLSAFAKQVAVDLKDDPAFPLIVANLEQIDKELNAIFAARREAR